ncbi:MAG: histidinol dehydrogenase [Bacteroidetes bacterium]|nr:histidinol dehydrogenase [Bacteroidota bacterium]
MKKIINPKRKDWLKLTQRPTIEKRELNTLVSQVFTDVKKEGDKALKKYSLLFDQVDLKSLTVSKKNISDASKKIPKELKAAIQLAKSNIEKFHVAQIEASGVIETTKGVNCWRESRAIEKIGIYIPGGSAPLFSTVLMLGIPAKLAGCKEIVLCTPPNKKGCINPAILYTANLVGITSVYSIGGIQAIAAMTFGTKTLPKADKIFGPGNQYVTAAKQVAQNSGIAIDMPAGPSEVLIIADKSCNPSFVAADLLSQAEHGADSQVILLSDDEKVLDRISIELKKQLKALPRKEVAEKALKNSKAIVLKNINECIEFSNIYAPEHLILATVKAKKMIPEITNAGSVFLGNYSCESAGDYASGTNHTLPTNGYARSYSGVSLDSFVKKITFQELSKEGIQNIGPAIELMAEAEQLFAHKNAVTLRLKSL